MLMMMLAMMMMVVMTMMVMMMMMPTWVEDDDVQLGAEEDDKADHRREAVHTNTNIQIHKYKPDIGIDIASNIYLIVMDIDVVLVLPVMLEYMMGLYFGIVYSLQLYVGIVYLCCIVVLYIRIVY